MTLWRTLAVLWLLLLPVIAALLWLDRLRNGDWKFFVLVPTTWSPAFWWGFWRDFYAARPLPALVVLLLFVGTASSLLVVTAKAVAALVDLARVAFVHDTAA